MARLIGSMMPPRSLQEQAKLAPQGSTAPDSAWPDLRQAKRYDEARQAFEKAAQLAPDNLAMRRSTRRAGLAGQDISTLPGREYGVSSKKIPIRRPPIFLKAKSWPRKENGIQPRQSFKRRSSSILISPSPTICWSRAYLATNKLPQAVSQLQALLSKNPNNTSALMTLALVYEQMKDYPKARDAYEKLLAINPNFVPALNNLAYLYTERLNDLDKAYELGAQSPRSAAARRCGRRYLGWVLYKRGDYQQALTILQESAEKAPTIRRFNFTWA